MREEEIPDLNVFMMCDQVNAQAFASLPPGFTIRNCRPDEVHIWKTFPFDTPELAQTYDEFMSDFFANVYARDPDQFFRNTLFACDAQGRPVATCSSWKAYDAFQSIHWLKTLKAYEGNGLGRALMTVIMQRFSAADFPVYLHTQPGSFRAIGLYSDFGFSLLSDPKIGTRVNHLQDALPVLEQFMSPQSFSKLRIRTAPVEFHEALKRENLYEF